MVLNSMPYKLFNIFWKVMTEIEYFKKTCKQFSLMYFQISKYFQNYENENFEEKEIEIIFKI